MMILNYDNYVHCLAKQLHAALQDFITYYQPALHFLSMSLKLTA